MHNTLPGPGTCPAMRGSRRDGQDDPLNNAHLLIDQMGLIPVTMPLQNEINCHKSSLHQRSQSLSGLQVNKVR